MGYMDRFLLFLLHLYAKYYWGDDRCNCSIGNPGDVPFNERLIHNFTVLFREMIELILHYVIIIHIELEGFKR